MGKIKGVIFDGGGVLINDPAPGLVSYCAKGLGVSEEDFCKAFEKFLHGFQTGKTSHRQFMEQIASELGVEMPEAECLWHEAFISAYRERQEMFELARRVGANGYRTALLTNTERPVMDFFAKQVDGLFDVYVFSCVEGTAKPERRIYEVTLERLGTKAEESVFIDDREDYIEGAKRVGLRTILFEGVEQVKNEFGRFGVRIEKSGAGGEGKKI